MHVEFNGKKYRVFLRDITQPEGQAFIRVGKHTVSGYVGRDDNEFPPTKVFVPLGKNTELLGLVPTEARANLEIKD